MAEEKIVPAWVVQQAVAKAIGEDVENLRGITNNGSHSYKVMVHDG